MAKLPRLSVKRFKRKKGAGMAGKKSKKIRNPKRRRFNRDRGSFTLMTTYVGFDERLDLAIEAIVGRYCEDSGTMLATMKRDSTWTFKSRKRAVEARDALLSAKLSGPGLHGVRVDLYDDRAMDGLFDCPRCARLPWKKKLAEAAV